MKTLRTYEGRTAEWQKTIKRVERYEKRFLLAVQALFREQRAVTMRRFNRLHRKSLEESTVLFDVDEWVNKFQEVYETHIIAAVRSAVSSYYANAGELLVHPAVRAAIGERTRLFSRLPNETTARKIKEVLERGFAEGLDIDEIAEGIRGVFSDAIDRRARLIARTEIMGASNFGTFIGAQAGGFPFKMWITSRDERVRHSHRIDGQVKKVEEPFELADGRKMMFPQDFNERCIIRPLLEDPFRQQPIPSGGGQPALEVGKLDFSDLPFGGVPGFRDVPINTRLGNLPDAHSRIRAWLKPIVEELKEERDKLLARAEKLTDEADEVFRKLTYADDDVYNELKARYDEILAEITAINEKRFELGMKMETRVFKEFLDAVIPPNVKHGKIKVKITGRFTGKYSRNAVKRKYIEELLPYLERIVPEGRTMQIKISLSGQDGRAFHRGADNLIQLYRQNTIETFVHEFWHAVENQMPDLFRYCKEYYVNRAAGSQASFYAAGEPVFLGSPPFKHIYQGKYYGLPDNPRALEVFTMTFEALASEINYELWLPDYKFIAINFEKIRDVLEDDEVYNYFVALLRRWWL